MGPKLRRYVGTCRMLAKNPDIRHSWTRSSALKGLYPPFRFGVEITLTAGRGDSQAMAEKITQRRREGESLETVQSVECAFGVGYLLACRSTGAKANRISSGQLTCHHCQPHWQRTVSDRWNLRRIALHWAHDLIHITASRWWPAGLPRPSGPVQQIP